MQNIQSEKEMKYISCQIWEQRKLVRKKKLMLIQVFFKCFEIIQQFRLIDSPRAADGVWSSHNRTVRVGDAEIPELRH